MSIHALAAAAAAQLDWLQGFPQDAPVTSVTSSSPSSRRNKIRASLARNDTNTVSMFFDTPEDEMEYAASIVSACSDHTVYAMQCTKGPSAIPSTGCGPNAEVSPPCPHKARYPPFK